MVDLIYLNEEGMDDIVADELKIGMGNEVAYIILTARKQVVDAHYIMPPVYQVVTQMTPDKAGPPCHQDTSHDNVLLCVTRDA